MKSCAPLLCLVLIFYALPAAAEIYKWTDAEGTVHYSDNPVRGAKPADLPQLQPLDRVATPPADNSSRSGANTAAPATEVALLRPLPDEIFRDGRGLVAVRAVVKPAVSPGQKLVYFLDGQPTPQSPTLQTALQLQNVTRGQHSLSVAVLGKGGEQLARSSAVSFSVLTPTVLGPTSQSDGVPPDQQPAGATTAPPTVRSPGSPAAPRFGTRTGVAGP